MKFRQLGRSGLKVSEICVGAMTFGSRFFNIGVVGQDEADRMVARSLDAGVNFFDTADVYSRGESEQILGRTLKSARVKRDAVIIATKVRAAMTDASMAGTGDVNNVGLSRAHIIASCEASLRRLGVDHIDLYQVHGWDIAAPLDETLRALDDLVRQGKVRYLGCSNWAARQLAKGIAMADERRWERFVSLQAYYSLVGRDLEHELLPLCREEGLAILPWSPLSGGFLTGKYRREKAGSPGGRRTDFNFPPIDEARGYDAVEACEAIARARGVTIARVALAWVLAQPGITSVIIGANKMSQLDDNLAAADLVLSGEEVDRLSAATAPPKLYPQWMIERQNMGRVVS